MRSFTVKLSGSKTDGLVVIALRHSRASARAMQEQSEYNYIVGA